MNETTIWKYLKANGLTDAGAAGLMGNLQAESGLQPTNLQNTFEKSLGFSDEAYTKAVDSGEYDNFVMDKAGYGLAQWTWHGRKQNLLNYARQRKTSIGDLQMQLDFMIKEIAGYKNVVAVLTTTDSVREASDIVLTQYEKPANQSEAVKRKRAGFGQEIYNRNTQGGESDMSNSSLATYTKISPNKTSPRNHKIDTITIHCMAGQLSVETCGNVFAPSSRQASSNYGIGPDGRIGIYVEEKDRSWCSSNGANDHRAITIEVASDAKHPYAVKDAAYKSLLNLVTDICKRNGIKKLVWSNSKSDRVNHTNGCNMTVHRDYANKSCPGDYLYNLHGQIAAEVNKRLGASGSEDKPQETAGYYRIRKIWADAKTQVGAYKNLDGAKKECDKHLGYSVFDDQGNKVYPKEVAPAFKEYTVIITCGVLNVRKGPSTSYGVATTVRKGEVYTIVGEQNGWGKLKSGAGWISLAYTKKH